MSWLADTTLRSITPIRGFGIGSSTVFLSWLEFSTSPALSPLRENADLLPWGRLWHQGKPLEDVVMVGDHLISGPSPPLRSFLWPKL
jgi:hypothetical protein